MFAFSRPVHILVIIFVKIMCVSWYWPRAQFHPFYRSYESSIFSLCPSFLVVYNCYMHLCPPPLSLPPPLKPGLQAFKSLQHGSPWWSTCPTFTPVMWVIICFSTSGVAELSTSDLLSEAVDVFVGRGPRVMDSYSRVCLPPGGVSDILTGEVGLRTCGDPGYI